MRTLTKLTATLAVIGAFAAVSAAPASNQTESVIRRSQIAYLESTDGELVALSIAHVGQSAKKAPAFGKPRPCRKH